MKVVLAWLLLSSIHLVISCRDVGCKRITKYAQNLGFDYSGQQLLRVDVGRCVVIAEEQKVDEGQLPEYVEPPCDCTAAEYEHITALTRNGPVTLQIISGCHTSLPSSCQRQESYHRFHSNTSYSTMLDLGSCTGACNSSKIGYAYNPACIPISKTSVAIEGPNGYSTIENITECGCAFAKCHRQDFYQLIQAQELIEDGNNTSFIMVEKAVNVGQCVGGCDNILFPGECFPSPDLCLINRGPIKAVCVPQSTRNETYLDVNGATRSIIVINSCTCGRQ